MAGDDLAPRGDFLLVNPERMTSALAWFTRHAVANVPLSQRIGKLFTFLTECRAMMKDGLATACEVAEMLAQQLGFPEHVQQTVRFTREHWDGKGPVYGLKGADIPIASRIIHLVQVLEVAHRFGGASLADTVARERRGTDFDPELVGCFLELSQRSDFWPVLEQESAQQTILEMRPQSPYDRLAESQVDAICEALGDFSDFKGRETWRHSQNVAETAVAIARGLGLGPSALTNVRRTALIHDLGKVAVPVSVLEKRNSLQEADWERFRLHPYYTERVLARISILQELGADAGTHHEWVNGQGYHRRLAGDQLPLAGRILAIADAYVLLTQQQAENRDPERALREIQPLVGTQFDPSCYEALAGTVGSATRPADREASSPVPLPRHGESSLTERELEVLREVAKGLTNRQIAQTLVISEKTVEHHLEHIYNKLGVSSRTSAAIFALQRGMAARVMGS